VKGTTTSVAIDLKISVALPLRRVRRNIDPQSWDECSKFWHPPPDATYMEKAISGGGFAKHPSPPFPGSIYGWNTLFEHFACAAKGCQAWFDNHLIVTAQKVLLGSSSLHLMAYNLSKGGYIDGAILGKKTVVNLDEGWIQGYESGSRTYLSSHKKVEFSPAVATGLAQAALGFAEVNKELAELACCLKAGAN
jgi:hypothetical protein